MARDWEQYVPLGVGLAVLAGGAIWAMRARREVTNEATVVQPQPIDIGSIVAAQSQLGQARLAAGVQLASQYLQALSGVEQAQLAYQLQLRQTEAQLQIAQIQAAAQAQAAQMAYQLELQRTQAQLEAARIQSQAQIEAARLQAEAQRAQYQAQAQAAQAAANAQAQSAFWSFLGTIGLAILLSRRVTQAAVLRRAAESRGIAAQARATRQLWQYSSSTYWGTASAAPEPVEGAQPGPGGLEVVELPTGGKQYWYRGQLIATEDAEGNVWAGAGTYLTREVLRGMELLGLSADAVLGSGNPYYAGMAEVAGTLGKRWEEMSEQERSLAIRNAVWYSNAANIVEGRVAPPPGGFRIVGGVAVRTGGVSPLQDYLIGEWARGEGGRQARQYYENLGWRLP